MIGKTRNFSYWIRQKKIRMTHHPVPLVSNVATIKTYIISSIEVSVFYHVLWQIQKSLSIIDLILCDVKIIHRNKDVIIERMLVCILKNYYNDRECSG